MTEEEFITKILVFKQKAKGTTMKGRNSILTREVFFLKRAQGRMFVCWETVEDILGLSKTDVVNKAGLDTLSFPLINTPLMYGDEINEHNLGLIKTFLADLPQQYIRKTGRFKGTKHWGKIMYHIHDKLNLLLTKDQLKAVAKAS